MSGMNTTQTHKHLWQKVPHIATILLVLGLAGGIGLRLTIFLRPFGTYVVDLVWYIAVLSHTIFYACRIAIENHRREICETGLLERLKINALTPEDTARLHQMLQSHCKSKIKYNYIGWLAISILSLVLAVLYT
jgi:hypothetical protein